MGQRHVTSEQLHVARQLSKDFRMSIKDSIDLVWASDTDNVRESFQGNVIMKKRYAIRAEFEVLAESSEEAFCQVDAELDAMLCHLQTYDIDVAAEEDESAEKTTE